MTHAIVVAIESPTTTFRGYLLIDVALVATCHKCDLGYKNLIMIRAMVWLVLCIGNGDQTLIGPHEETKTPTPVKQPTNMRHRQLPTMSGHMIGEGELP